MARYFYAWTPAVVVVAMTVILTIPYLALIVFVVVLVAAFAALGTLARAIIAVSFGLGRSAIGRAVARRSPERSDTGQRVALNPGDAGRGGTR
jgi:hypothetical protein